MNNLVKYTIILLIVCAFSAFILSSTYSITKEKIRETQQKEELIKRKEIFKDADSFEEVKIEMNESINSVIKVKKSEKIIGYILNVRSQGFGGELELVVGINVDKKIEGIRINKHQETPGLGDNANKPEFYSQYNNLEATKVNTVKSNPTKNDIVAISGATITSKAITDGVNLALDFFNKELINEVE